MLSAAATRGKEDTPRTTARTMQELRVSGAAGNGELGIGWTVAYYVLLVAGAVLFWQGLWRLTESGNALAKFGEVVGKS